MMPFARKSPVENPKTAANGKYHSKPLQLYLMNPLKVIMRETCFLKNDESLSEIFSVPIVSTKGETL